MGEYLVMARVRSDILVADICRAWSPMKCFVTPMAQRLGLLYSRQERGSSRRSTVAVQLCELDVTNRTTGHTVPPVLLDSVSKPSSEAFEIFRHVLVFLH
jgi:hypothetical protein